MHDGYPNRCRFQEMLRFRGSELGGFFWEERVLEGPERAPEVEIFS